MKKIVLILTVGIWITVLGVEIPKSTENSGMNKYERINKIEKELIALAKRVQRLERALLTQRDNFQAKSKKEESGN
jgi:hypothetical protein